MIMNSPGKTPAVSAADVGVSAEVFEITGASTADEALLNLADLAASKLQKYLIKETTYQKTFTGQEVASAVLFQQFITNTILNEYDYLVLEIDLDETLMQTSTSKVGQISIQYKASGSNYYKTFVVIQTKDKESDWHKRKKICIKLKDKLNAYNDYKFYSTSSDVFGFESSVGESGILTGDETGEGRGDSYDYPPKLELNFSNPTYIRGNLNLTLKLYGVK